MGIVGSVESERIPQQGTAWRTARGCMGLWAPGPSLLVVSFVGHGEAGFVTPLLGAYRSLSKVGRTHLVVDAESLSNYDSPPLSFRTAPGSARFTCSSSRAWS
jgi:hypothetical protein